MAESAGADSAEAWLSVEPNLHEFQLIKPGQFNQARGGDLVFFMESVSEDKLELRDVIISRSGAMR